MTTQADITLALFNVNQTATTLQTNIGTLINAIADQSTITQSKKLSPTILAQINGAAASIATLIATIAAVAGSSAV